MIRFLHLADVHLDTTFAGRPQHRTLLRDAQLKALERAVDCALEEHVDAVLIAGDLFDNDRLTLRTEYFLMRQLGRLHEAGITCVYVSGNHDPGGSRFRAGGLGWPPSFQFIKGKRAETIDVVGPNGEVRFRVSGAGHIDDRVRDNLAEGFPGADPDLPHVGLLHTTIVSARSSSEHERYAPCTVEDLQRPGYAYWALGHIHLRQMACDRSNAWYSGNIMGRNPKESGPKGGLLVTLDGRQVRDVSFRAFAPVQWLDVQLSDLDTISTVQQLEEAIARDVRAAQSDQPEASEWFVRVRLSGATPLAGPLRDSAQIEEIEAAFADGLGVTDLEIRSSNITHPIDLAEHRGQPHVLGEVLALLDEMQRDESDVLSSISDGALVGGQGDEYVKGLLEGLDRLAAERLIVEGS